MELFCGMLVEVYITRKIFPEDYLFGITKEFKDMSPMYCHLLYIHGETAYPD